MDKKYPFKVWDYEKQTEMKHLVFSDYFDKWIKILGKYRSLNYIDCFGGIGAYQDKNKLKPGSPILAAQVIQNNKDRLNRDTNLIIIEQIKSNIDNIQKVLEYCKIDMPVHYINDDFDTAINELLDEVTNLKPTFFLVDPFGFKIKLGTLKRIMQIEKSEIFFNFMYNGICRNLSVKEAEKTINELFGDAEWKGICDDSDTKEKEIVKLFKGELKKFCRYVFYYRICFPDMKDRTYYYMFHLTNHYKGCSIMKSCFAKYNQGRLEYNAKKNEFATKQATLIDVDNLKKESIKKDLLHEFKGRRLSYEDIITELIDSNDYLESEIVKALREMGSEKKVVIERIPPTTPTGKIRESIQPKDEIIF